MIGLKLAVLISLHYCIKFIVAQSADADAAPRVCCDPDQVVSPCFSPCEENTCDNLLNITSKACTDCISNICVCRDGLYRTQCGTCVPAEKCSKPCQMSQPIKCNGINERLYGCLDPTQARVCPSTRCSKPRDFLLKFSRSSPQQGLCAPSMCDCIDGFLRNKCGQCVLPSECGKKCCLGKCSPCSGQNEVRMKKFRKCHERSCKNLLWPKKCTGKAGRVRKNVCDCMIGYRRNNCGQCVLESQCNDNVPCLCTDPCGLPGREWQCVNPCNTPICKNYYELKAGKVCPTDCIYACACKSIDNLYFNSTDCVPAEQCPPYEIAKDIVYRPVSDAIYPIPANIFNPPTTTPPPTTSPQTAAPIIVIGPIQITPAPAQSPGVSQNPLISITLSIGKK